MKKEYQFILKIATLLAWLPLWFDLGAAAASEPNLSVQLPVEPPRLIALSADGQVLRWVENGSRGDRIMVRRLSGEDSRSQRLWRTDGWIDGIDNLGKHLLVRTRNDGWVRWYQVQWPSGGQTLLLSEQVKGRKGPQPLQVLSDDQVLFSNDRRQPWQPDLMILGPASHASLERGEQNIFRWHPAPDGRTLIARRWRVDDQGPIYEWLWRSSSKESWTVVRQRRLSEPRWQLNGFSLAENAAYFQPEDRKQPVTLDLSTGALLDLSEGRLVHQSAPRIDGGGGSQNTMERVNADLPAEHWAFADSALTARPRRWLGQSDADAIWQIGPDPSGLQVLKVKQSAIAPVEGIGMTGGAAVSTHYVPSRDGRSIEVLLTEPADTAAGKGQVMVLLIHGGPWSHDEAGWHPEAQWLASLGYSVLQANFRGSTNAGYSWQWAGRQQWSGKMLDDLEDALTWAKQERVFGAERVCTMGSSFGGFAALMLSARDKIPLRCVVARAPVSDLAAQMGYLNAIGNLRGFQEWREMVGDPLTQDLRAGSPIGIAQNIRGPVLLGHGQNDDVVQWQQSQRLLTRLQAVKGAEVQWVNLLEQGHNLRASAARRLWYTQVARFLDRARQSSG